MKPEEVPDELVDAGREALHRHLASLPSASLHITTYEERVRAVLAAVLPLHEKQLREQIVKEIEAERAKVGDHEGATLQADHVIGAICNGLSQAMRIARGESR